MPLFKERLRSRLAGQVPEPHLRQLPAGYQRVGSIALIELSPALRKHAKRIAHAVHEELPWATTIALRGQVRGALRTPSICALWPAHASLRTVHRESGIRYAIDLRQAMFSKGNAQERHRLAKALAASAAGAHGPRSDEVVADMFAGIGYFSLPLAKAGARVYAIEKNPRAFALLRENIALNRLQTIVPVLRDCRRARLPEPVDRVLLGYFPRTERYLPAAFALCKDRATLHFHNTYRTSELWKLPEQQLQEAAGRAGFTARVVARRVVKPVSPSVRHVVLDLAISRTRTSRAGLALRARNARYAARRAGKRSSAH